MGNHFARPPREIDEQIKFFWREMDFLPFYFDRSRIQIDGEISRHDRGRLFVCYWTSPQLRPNSCQEFVHAERLGDVIVSPRVQRFYLRTILPAHREHD